MSFTFDIVNDDDTVLFGLNDSDGTKNPYGIKTFCFDVDFGAASGAPSFFSPSVPGGSLIARRHELVQMSWSQGITNGQSADNIRRAVGELLRLLDAGGTFKITPTSGATPFYIDFETGPLSSMLRAQQIGAVKLYSQFHDPDGMPLAVMRQPYFREAVISSDTNLLTNSTLLRDVDGNGIPDGWSVQGTGSETSPSIDPRFEAWRVTYVTTGNAARRRYQDFPAAPGENFTMQVEGRINFGYSQSPSFRVDLEFLDSGGGSLATTMGTSSSHSTGTDFVTVTVGAIAPASTVTVRAKIVMANTAADSATFLFRRAILQKGLSPSSVFSTGDSTITNDPSSTTTAGRSYPIWIHGSAPAPVSFTLTPQGASDKIQAVNLAARSSGGKVGGNYLSDYFNSTRYFQLAAGTLYNSAATLTDADAFGGSAVRTPALPDFSQLTRYVRVEHTTELDSLRGPWNIVARFKASTASEWALQLKWGASSADPTSYSESEVTHDVTTSGITSYGYVEKSLGQIHIPEDGDLSAVVFEVWARRKSSSGSTTTISTVTGDAATDVITSASHGLIDGDALQFSVLTGGSGLTTGTTYYVRDKTANTFKLAATPGGTAINFTTNITSATIAVSPYLVLDAIVVQPTDTSARVVVPFASRTPTRGKDTWHQSASIESGNSLIVPTTRFAGVGHEVLPAGRHRLTFRYSIQDAETATNIIFGADDYTGAFGAVAPSTTLSTWAVAHAKTGDFDDVSNTTTTVEFGADGVTKYGAYAYNAGGTTAVLILHEIIHEFSPVITQNQQIHTVPDSVERPTVYKRDSNGAIIQELAVQGATPMWLPPGLSIVYVDVQEPVRSGLYAEYDSQRSRDFTLAYSYAPRHLA